MLGWQKMTQPIFDLQQALNDLYVQFWFNTMFDQNANGDVTISFEEFNILAQMCIEIQRGQT